MFGISLPELVLVMLILFIVVGPKRLPEVARTLGRTMGTLRRSTEGIRREMYNAIYQPAENLQQRLAEAERSLTASEPKEKEDWELTCEEQAQADKNERSPEAEDSSEPKDDPKDQ